MSNKENTNSVNVFYGVSLPLDAIANESQLKDVNLVLDNKKEALEVLKRFKGSRFKAFPNKEEAILFSKEGIKPEVSSSDANQSNRNIERSLSPFNGLHPRELTQLRKAIETDKYEIVSQLIWSNPRYLVSSGDTPVILMEGPRYNACHVAAKAAKHRVLRLVLNTVSDQRFMKLLFPYDSDEITKSRIDFLLDLYLNTPDKGFCETPLHFGCKFGSPETVSVLLGFPECDTEKTNKCGRKPSEMICERKGDKNAKTEIERLFEAQLYIPVFRDDSGAQFGQPFKGAIEDRRVTGLAGPMSPTQVQLFNTLKSPRKCTPKEKSIRLTDSRKGLERIARNLCKDMNINWTEFWPFLNTRIDLTSDEGLDRLEKHLRTVYWDMDRQSSKENTFFSDDNIDDNINNNLFSLSNDLSKLSLKSALRSDETNDSERDVLFEDFDSNENKTSLSVSVIKEDSYDSDSDESFTTALSSPTFLFDFYINGSSITREDLDAALAVQHIIDSERCSQYEFTQNWFQRVFRENPKYFDCETTAFPSLTSTPIKK